MIRPRTSSATLLQDSSMDEFKKWRQKQRMADERERTLQGGSRYQGEKKESPPKARAYKPTEN